MTTTTRDGAGHYVTKTPRKYRRPGGITKALRCAICNARQEEGTTVRHFNLILPQYVADGDGFRMRMRGAGTIDLCELCWRIASAESRVRRGWTKA